MLSFSVCMQKAGAQGGGQWVYFHNLMEVIYSIFPSHWKDQKHLPTCHMLDVTVSAVYVPFNMFFHQGYARKWYCAPDLSTWFLPFYLRKIYMFCVLAVKQNAPSYTLCRLKLNNSKIEKLLGAHFSYFFQLWIQT